MLATRNKGPRYWVLNFSPPTVVTLRDRYSLEWNCIAGYPACTWHSQFATLRPSVTFAEHVSPLFLTLLGARTLLGAAGITTHY